MKYYLAYVYKWRIKASCHDEGLKTCWGQKMSSPSSLAIDERERAGSQPSYSHQDSFPFFYNATVVEGGSVMTEEERSILEERRAQIEAYCPPYITGLDPDPVSGEEPRVPISTRASIFLSHSLCVCMFVKGGGSGDVCCLR